MTLPRPQIPDYELLRLIGQGSYGQVWLARSVTGALRAIKIVHRSSFDHDRPYEREFEGINKFEPISQARESQVAIFHVGRNDTAGFFYYVMELADDASSSIADRKCSILNAKFLDSGSAYIPRTLKHDLRTKGALPISECLSLAQSLATALDHLHSHNLVHRDIKPSNIIFVNGHPKLADIGLVTSTDATRSFVGTDGYIPPEGPGTPQADIYSLGKVLYECVTGKDRNDFPELPENVRSSPDRGLLAQFNEILLRASAKDIRKRYRSAEQILRDVELLKHGRSLGKLRLLHFWSNTPRLSTAVAFIVLLTIGAVLLVPKLLTSKRRIAPELHSRVPGVDQLMAEGNVYGGSSTPEWVDKALKAFQAAVEKDPTFPPAHVGLFGARLGVWSGRNPPADAEYNLRLSITNMVAIAPRTGEAKIALAILRRLESDFDGAIRLAERAEESTFLTERGPLTVGIIHGWLLQNAGRLDEALACLLRTAKEFKADAGVTRFIGQTYYLKRDFKKALEFIDKSIDLEPRHVWDRVIKGSIFEEMRDFPQAIREFEAADLLAGKDKTATTRFYGDLRAAVERDPESGYWKERLRKALAASPQESRYIAALHARLGRKTEAYEWLERASREGKLEGLWFDLCWDREDEPFKKAMKQFGGGKQESGNDRARPLPSN